MMQRFLTLFFLLLSSVLLSKVTVYFNYGVFNTPSSKPYLETYLTISGNSVKFLPSNGSYQASINVSWKIIKGADIVKASNYNLMSPKANDTLHLPSFIDNQRFSLENGSYTLELVVTDNAYPDIKTTHSEKINILFNREKKIYASDIQILESFTKISSPTATSKNGYELIPYNINYFPKSQNSLKFYMEAYNVDSVLGKKSKFVYSYYLENSESLAKQRDLAGFQKQHGNVVNPLLAQLDITMLPSGNYNLVIEIKDSANIIQLQKKWFFQRQSDSKEDLSVSAENTPIKINTIEEFFNAYQSSDTLKQFVECLWPRSSIKEREWQQTQIVKKDPNLMRGYLIDYWKAEAGDSLDPLKIWKTYYQSVLEANALLKCGKQKGYYTDRGRVYLQYGKPNQRNQVNSEPNTYPYEVWQYYRLYDKTTGRFFSNKKFVFANFAIADDCYQLIHSDVKGEMYDERWKYKLMRRSEQSNNLDDTKPTNSYGNNVEDNFNNPR